MNQPDVAQKIIDAGEAGLWEQTDTLLSARLTSDPDNLAVLSTLALSHRQRGDLENAAKLYRHISELDPADSASRMLAAVCSEMAPPTSIPENQLHPAPFVLRRNFLPVALRQQLMDLLSTQESDLQELDVNYIDENKAVQGAQDRAMRHQLGIYCQDDLRRIVQPMIEEQLSAFVEALQIGTFRAGEHTLRLDATPHDGFGRMHQDVGFGAQLIYLYYFHSHPRQFTGGHLLIHDQHVAENRPAPDRFTAIPPDDNTLVVFAPHYFHQVTRVRALTEPLNTVDSRLSVCGFVHPAADQ